MSLYRKMVPGRSKRSPTNEHDSEELKDALTQWDSLIERESLRVQEVNANIVLDPRMKEINSKIEELNTNINRQLEALKMLRESRTNIEPEIKEEKEKEIPSLQPQLDALKVRIKELRSNSISRGTSYGDIFGDLQTDSGMTLGDRAKQILKVIKIGQDSSSGFNLPKGTFDKDGDDF